MYYPASHVFIEYITGWKEMEYFLISFKYEHYCQGYEWDTTQVLVKASTFEYACAKIESDTEYESACNFINLTL
jgi:hypothetical protein